jgi:hypothetical protein
MKIFECVKGMVLDNWLTRAKPGLQLATASAIRSALPQQPSCEIDFASFQPILLPNIFRARSLGCAGWLRAPHLGGERTHVELSILQFVQYVQYWYLYSLQGCTYTHSHSV